MGVNKELAGLSDGVRDAVEYIVTGRPRPVRITKYVGKIKVEIRDNGKVEWSLQERLKHLPNLDLDTFTSWSEVIKTAMKHLDQGDEGFAQLLGIPVSTVRAWKRGARDPRGPGRRLLEVSLKHPGIMWDVVKESEATYG